MTRIVDDERLSGAAGALAGEAAAAGRRRPVG